MLSPSITLASGGTMTQATTSLSSSLAMNKAKSNYPRWCLLLQKENRTTEEEAELKSLVPETGHNPGNSSNKRSGEKRKKKSEESAPESSSIPTLSVQVVTSTVMDQFNNLVDRYLR